MENILTFRTILINAFLFVIKIIAGIMYNSISLISDALNSLTDIVSSIVVHMSVIISHKKPDHDHPFGHARYQPLAAIVIAIIMCFLGIQIIIYSIERMISGEKLVMGFVPIIVSAIVVIVKAIFFIYATRVFKKTKSVAIKAQAIDHRNDVLLGFTVFLGIFLANFGINTFDSVAAFVIGAFVFFAGYELVKENLGYTVGLSADDSLYSDISKIADKVPEVMDIHYVKAQLMGTEVQVEAHISINKEIKIKKAHDIAHKVGQEIEKLPDVGRAFIHVDPFTGKKYSLRKYN